MVRKTKEDAQKTREAIIEAASHVFVEKGVANASLNEIASRAGVTRGAVYWHFENKIDLFKALHESLSQPFIDRILNNLEQDQDNPLDQLKDLCITMLDDLTDNEHKQRVLKILFFKCDYSGEYEELLQVQCQNKKEKLALFAQYFERAQKKGTLRADISPAIMATSLMSYIGGIANEWLRYPETMDLKKQGRDIIDLYFNGLYSR